MGSWPPDESVDEDLPLAGIKVLDLSRILAGPMAAQLLADLGADVIKVEPPSGDETRRWGPPFVGDDAAYYLSLNRNRRGVRVDLRVPHERNVVGRLAAEADVVIENYLPNQMEDLNIWEFRDLARRAVWVSIRSAAAGGPLARLPGFDAMTQARSGIMSTTGARGGIPTKVGIPVADIVTGHYAASTALAVLVSRFRRGDDSPVHVEVPLFECALASLVNQGANFLAAGVVAQPLGNDHPSVVPYGCFDTADRPIMIGAATNKQFRALCRVLGHPDLADDSSFASNSGRVEHRELLIPKLEELLSRRTAAAWEEALAAAAVPCAPVNDVREALGEAQVGASGILQAVAGAHGEVHLVGCPVTINGMRPGLRRPPPTLGSDDRAVRPSAAG